MRNLTAIKGENVRFKLKNKGGSDVLVCRTEGELGTARLTLDCENGKGDHRYQYEALSFGLRFINTYIDKLSDKLTMKFMTPALDNAEENLQSWLIGIEYSLGEHATVLFAVAPKIDDEEDQIEKDAMNND